MLISFTTIFIPHTKQDGDIAISRDPIYLKTNNSSYSYEKNGFATNYWPLNTRYKNDNLIKKNIIVVILGKVFLYVKKIFVLLWFLLLFILFIYLFIFFFLCFFCIFAEFLDNRDLPSREHTFSLSSKCYSWKAETYFVKVGHACGMNEKGIF